MKETVGRASRFKCFWICNSTSIVLSTSQLSPTFSILFQFSESDKRGVTGNHPKGAGDLFEPDTTRAEILSLGNEIIKRGTRISDDPKSPKQTFELKTKFKGERGRFKAVVHTPSKSIITVFPAKSE